MSQRKTIFMTILLISVLSWMAQGSLMIFGEEKDYDWPRWRGPNGDGISKETGWNPAALKDGPRILWKANVGMGYSNVAIKDNRLYTMGCKGREYTIVCLNAETGKEIWRRVVSENLMEPQATPAIDGEFLYALSKEGLLLCLKI